MKLLYTPLSPFARKVRVFAAEAGLGTELQLQSSDIWADDSDIWSDNPAGTVPALLTPDGTFIGSWLCCEYLDSLHDQAPLIPDDARRWPVRQLHASADGMMVAAVAHVTERLRRPADRVHTGWLERQEKKISGLLRHLRQISDTQLNSIDVATITLACALRYLELRLPDLNWKQQCPELGGWYRDFAVRKSMLDSDVRL